MCWCVCVCVYETEKQIHTKRKEAGKVSIVEYHLLIVHLKSTLFVFDVHGKT